MVVRERMGKKSSMEAVRRARERGQIDATSIQLQEGGTALQQALTRIEQWAQAASIASEEAERRAAYALGVRDVLSAVSSDVQPVD